MEKFSIFDSVLEAGNHFKNRASSKSQMCRGNFLRRACIGVLVSSIIFSGCKNDDGGSKSKFTRMNIKDAKTLFIASSNSGSKMYGVKNSSLKSTSEGDEIYEISYLDENDKPIEEKIPNCIHDAGDFLIVIFSERFSEPDAYFVKKSDGSVYKIPDEYFPSINGNNELFFNQNTNIRRFRYTNFINDFDFLNFCYDKDKNIYYTITICPGIGACPQILYKVSSITSASINFKQVSNENDNVWGYCIDDNGNLIYSSGEHMRYVSANGSIGNPIPIIVRQKYGDFPLEIYRFVWAGTDGIMSLKEETAEQLPDGGIIVSSEYPRYFLMKMENGQFVKKREITLDFSKGYPSSYNVFYVHGKVIYSHYYGSTATLVDISNENSYREIPCSVEANIVINGELYHFDRNTFSLTHINIDNGTTTQIFTLDKSVLNDYIIACIMDVTENDILFGAYRLSDQMRVVAKIEKGNVFTILQSNSGNVSVIMPLNP